jgi:hypothetical protein
MNTSTEFYEEFKRLGVLLEAGLDALKRHVVAYADAEAAYRKAKAEAWLIAPRFTEEIKVTAGEREAWVEGQTSKVRHARDIADGMKQAALEAVRSRRAQISALQTLLNAHQEEARFVRTGPS